jgi:hypothetical protein
MKNRPSREVRIDLRRIRQDAELSIGFSSFILMFRSRPSQATAFLTLGTQTLAGSASIIATELIDAGRWLFCAVVRGVSVGKGNKDVSSAG